MTHSWFVQRLRFWAVWTVWILVAALCYLFMPLALWGDVAGNGLITVLGLLVGAILIRIMRPFPIIDPDSFKTEEDIQALKSAYLDVTKLVVWAGGAAGVMLVLMLIIVAAEETLTAISILRQGLDNILSAVAGFLAVFLVRNICYFVQLDLDIVRMQAGGVQEVFRKKQEAIQRQNEELYGSAEEDSDDFPDEPIPYLGEGDTT